MSDTSGHINYETIPGFGAQYLKFFVKGKKKFSARPQGLVTGASVQAVQADQAKLQRYRSACGFAENGTLPLLYPHILTSSMHMSLMARDTFPLSPLGAVHARNHILQHSALPESGAFDLRCTMDYDAFRVLKQGAEADILTTVTVDGKVVWESVSTYLFRGKFGEPGEAHALGSLPELSNANHQAEWEIPKSMGKKYAGITGDYNPIHINKYAAKLFGFSRDIIHGMWNLAQAVNHLPPHETDGPLRLDALFKGPAFIGSKMALQSESADATHRFDCYCGKNPRPVIVGRYGSTAESDRLVDGDRAAGSNGI